MILLFFLSFMTFASSQYCEFFEDATLREECQKTMTSSDCGADEASCRQACDKGSKDLAGSYMCQREVCKNLPDKNAQNSCIKDVFEKNISTLIGDNSLDEIKKNEKLFSNLQFFAHLGSVVMAMAYLHTSTCKVLSDIFYNIQGILYITLETLNLAGTDKKYLELYNEYASIINNTDLNAASDDVQLKSFLYFLEKDIIDYKAALTQKMKTILSMPFLALGILFSIIEVASSPGNDCLIVMPMLWFVKTSFPSLINLAHANDKIEYKPIFDLEPTSANDALGMKSPKTLAKIVITGVEFLTLFAPAFFKTANKNHEKLRKQAGGRAILGSANLAFIVVLYLKIKEKMSELQKRMDQFVQNICLMSNSNHINAKSKIQEELNRIKNKYVWVPQEKTYPWEAYGRYYRHRHYRSRSQNPLLFLNNLLKCDSETTFLMPSFNAYAQSKDFSPTFCFDKNRKVDGQCLCRKNKSCFNIFKNKDFIKLAKKNKEIERMGKMAQSILNGQGKKISDQSILKSLSQMNKIINKNKKRHEKKYQSLWKKSLSFFFKGVSSINPQSTFPVIPVPQNMKTIKTQVLETVAKDIPRKEGQPPHEKIYRFNSFIKKSDSIWEKISEKYLKKYLNSFD